jgi:hypothetical protein
MARVAKTVAEEQYVDLTPCFVFSQLALWRMPQGYDLRPPKVD